jgi:hypothetical protein
MGSDQKDLPDPSNLERQLMIIKMVIGIIGETKKKQFTIHLPLALLLRSRPVLRSSNNLSITIR